MKQVNLMNDQVVKRWASQQYEYGCSKNGNLFFEDVTLYSYGYHFPLARFYDTTEGVFVLFSAKAHTRSSTTREHSRLARFALSEHQHDYFEVPNVKAEHSYLHRQNVLYFIEGVEQCLRRADRRRISNNKNMDLALAHRARKAAIEYAHLFEVYVDWDEHKKTFIEVKLRSAVGV